MREFSSAAAVSSSLRVRMVRCVYAGCVSVSIFTSRKVSAFCVLPSS